MDLEYKKGRFGALLRAKYWYDEALNQENVLIGSQANNFNGVRPRLGPIPGYSICTAATPPGAACLPMSPPGQNLWPKGKLSDRGFEAEQQFENVYLLDAYVYGSFAVGNSDLQLRVGNQVINWGESIFIQGVNQINPIDVPAARRAGAELKEILLPVWAVYANWGFDFGSIEAFYQLKWNNTSVDACGTYFSATSTLIGADPGSCDSLTVLRRPVGQPSVRARCHRSSRSWVRSPSCKPPAPTSPASTAASRATPASSAWLSVSRSKSSTRNSACTQ